ncbi:MAG: glutamine synthetase beta-grasp domain-containing protein, partial [Alphaproteobacteria bacterium]|nr:glutamine synthetase beta-grasp domain-containing protein [Alphaproteobacteria bacterium]
MSDAVQKVLDMIKEHNVEYVDFRFTDPRGKWQHTAQHVCTIDEDIFKDGIMFDGSSIAGWKAINESDMILMPDPETAVMDPFTAQPQMILFCDILEPSTGLAYDRDPRSIAKKALAYTESLGIGDTVYFGPEAEFFIFDDARWSTEQNLMAYSLDSEEGPYNSYSEYEGGNMGH